MKTKVQMKGLDLGMFHKNLFHRKKKGKNKKTFVDRNGIRTGEEIGFPNFILKKVRKAPGSMLCCSMFRMRSVKFGCFFIIPIWFIPDLFQFLFHFDEMGPKTKSRHP